MDTLRRVTDLFLLQPQQFDNEQIALFDDVLTHMIARVETKARAELAKRLAPVDQAPNEVIRQLAHDDEITVAGPVLSQSSRLTTADLVDIAAAKGPGASARDRRTQRRRAAGHRGAGRSRRPQRGASARHECRRVLLGDRIHEAGPPRRVPTTISSKSLAGASTFRCIFFRELLLKAGEAVRNRLMAVLGPERRDLVRQVVEEMSAQVAHQAPAARNIEAAQRLVQALKEQGRLKEPDVLAFAQRGKLDEVIASLALLCAVSCDLVDRLLRSGRADAVLVPCKAMNFGWPTARAILGARAQGCGEQDLANAETEYLKLSVPTAARVLRFWQVRQATQAQGGDQVPQPTAAE